MKKKKSKRKRTDLDQPALTRQLEKESEREKDADHQEVSSPSVMDPQKVGTANGEAGSRGELDPPRPEQRTPRLLQRLDQQKKTPRRPRTPTGGNLEAKQK
jgi:hypothetical protein